MTGNPPGPGKKGFALDDYALYNLNRTAATYNDVMAKALKAYDLDTVQWRILMLLDDHSPCSVGELARRAVTKMPTVTRMLTRMEEQGLVVRRAGRGDRRFTQIRMTQMARKTLATVQAIGNGVYERAFEGVGARDIERLTQTLKRMRENLNRSPYDKSQNKRKIT